MRLQLKLILCVSLAVATASTMLVAQVPLAPIRPSGQTVTPVFEGWYLNDDGSYSISFGYFNRNAAEVLDIPVGPDNFVQPGDSNQGQPTQFQPRRNWGVFAVRVPTDFGDKQIVWTLKIRGETFSIPGTLHPDWQIDALEGEAGSGNTPPVLRFEEHGAEGRGPGGVTAGPLKATVGTALALTVFASDDGKSVAGVTGAARAPASVALAWFKHQGPGDVTFSQATARVAASGGKATTTASFSKPGDYVVRVRANDASGIAGAGHAQCCWTNGFVKVSVTP